MGQYKTGNSTNPSDDANPECGSHIPTAIIIPEVRISGTLGRL